MRIAIDGMLLLRSQSGVEYSILNLARALAEHGAEDYRLYVPQRSECNLPASERLRLVPSGLSATSRIWRILWEQLRLPAAIRRDGCQLLHAPGYLAPLRCSCPIVLTVYDLMALSHPHWCRPSNRINYRLLLSRSIKRADAIIVPSAFTRGELLARFPSAEQKLHVVPLAVSDAIRQTPSQTDLVRVREQYDLPASYLLFVGRHEPKKNMEGLVRSFHHLRSQHNTPHKLVIAGVAGWGQAGLTAYIRQRGLQDDVRFVGYVAEQDMAALYCQAELFVFPSLYEGFGLPPLEAMYCGVPVVCSNSTALPEVVGDAAILIDPLDPQSIAQGIYSGLRDRALRERLIENGRRQSRRMSWTDIARRTESIYYELLSRTTHQAGGRPT